MSFFVFKLVLSLFLVFGLWFLLFIYPYIQKVRSYYNSGKYERDVKKICNKAWEYFSSLEVTDKSLIIFDIDDTALYNSTIRKIYFLKQPKSLAILPVLELYKNLVKKGFKIIFITSRVGLGKCEEAKHNLDKVGYDIYEEIFCMPKNLVYDLTVKSKEWKLQIRKRLSRKYTIIGSIADRDIDFYGGYNGHAVKLPNLLYR